PASIHDRIAFRSHITYEDLIPDLHPRSMFVDYWASSGQEATVPAYVKAAVRGTSVSFDRAGHPSIGKRIRITADGIFVRYVMRARSHAARGALTVELNLSMPSCDGPGGAYVFEGARIGGFDSEQRIETCRAIELIDSELAGSLDIRFS